MSPGYAGCGRSVSPATRRAGGRACPVTTTAPARRGHRAGAVSLSARCVRRAGDGTAGWAVLLPMPPRCRRGRMQAAGLGASCRRCGRAGTAALPVGLGGGRRAGVVVVPVRPRRFRRAGRNGRGKSAPCRAVVLSAVPGRAVVGVGRYGGGASAALPEEGAALRRPFCLTSRLAARDEGVRNRPCRLPLPACPDPRACWRSNSRSSRPPRGAWTTRSVAVPTTDGAPQVGTPLCVHDPSR